MNRKTQKAKLKEILETAEYDFGDGSGDVNISVSDNFINNADLFPYFFIVGRDTTNEIQSTGRRRITRTFELKTSFELNPDNPFIFEDKMNDIEEVVRNKLNDRQYFCIDGVWEDMEITNVQYPWSGNEFFHLDNQIFLTFTVRIISTEVYSYV